MIARHYPILVFMGITLFLLNCAHEISAPEPSVDDVDYDGISAIVYSQHIQPIFNQKCMFSGCHNSVDRAAGLQLTAWEELIKGSESGEDIISGSSEHSPLVEHLRGEFTPRMPLERDPLPDKMIDFIARWIDEGAKNDAGQRPYEEITKKAYVTNQGDDLVSVISTEHN
ncbi:MAG: c-type cytochrome domain-containing protein, partial [bacterium]